MIKGIDVSYYQRTVDWPKVKADGIEFAMIKATEGVGYTDPNLAVYAKGATAAGLHIGAYHFLRAGDAQEQARQFMAAIKPYKWDYPLGIDVEHNELLTLGKTKLADMIIAFCEAVKAAGYYPMIYSNLNWCLNYLDMTRLKAYDLWFARYNETAGYDGVSIWQYSNTGKIDGINGNVDLDISYKDYPSMINAVKTAVQIDTTMDISFAHGQYYLVKTISPKPVTLTAGTGGVVTIVPFPRSGDDQLFALVAIGQAGQETGIFTAVTGEKPLKRFVYKIK